MVYIFFQRKLEQAWRLSGKALEEQTDTVELEVGRQAILNNREEDPWKAK
jgi:hypothetical protein